MAFRGVTIAVALAIFPLKAELPGAFVAGLPGCAAGECAGRFGAAAEAATADGFSFFPWGAADLPCAPVVFLSGLAAGLPRPCAACGRAAAGLCAALAAGALPRAFAFAALPDATGAAARLPEAGLCFGAGAATLATAGLRPAALAAAGVFFAAGLDAGLAFAALRTVFADCGFAAALAGLRGGVALPAGLAVRFGAAFVAADLAMGVAARFGAGLPADFFAGLPPLAACAFTFAVTDFAFAVAWADVRGLPFVCELAEPASLFLFAISSHHALAVAAGFYNPSVLYRQARIWNTGAHASPRLLGQVNPLTRLILWMLHLYKRMLSPLLGPRCRFHPSCSDYARIAVTRFGPWRGSLLAAWRLLRCQPLCAGGDDPVPENFHFPHCKRPGDPPDGH